MSNFIISIMVTVALLGAILTTCFMNCLESEKESTYAANSQCLNAENLKWKRSKAPQMTLLLPIFFSS